jgi:predicted ATPase
MYDKNYSSVVNNSNVGNSGEYTAHFIETYGSNFIEFDNLLHKDSKTIDTTTDEIIINRTLINQINLWMGEISPGINIRTTSISSEFVLLQYDFTQPNFGYTNKYNPENVGFGITYGLPVVTALLASKPGQLLIIENPESHIHPRGQAELGKLIAKTAMNDVQIIIETHSDHILNGIRVAVKENEIANDKVAIFYYDKIVEASEQYTRVEDIKIDKNGELSDYPKNMLDEWSNQLFKLM